MGWEGSNEGRGREISTEGGRTDIISTPGAYMAGRKLTPVSCRVTFYTDK